MAVYLDNALAEFVDFAQLIVSDECLLYVVGFVLLGGCIGLIHKVFRVL